jgi:hypothetical protein
MGKLVDFGKLSNVITQVEMLFNKEELNHIEKDLVIRELNGRLAVVVQRQRTQDLMNNIPLGNLMKKVMRHKEEEDD